MDSHRRTRPSVDNRPVVVTAPTLKEAYRKIKNTFGNEAVILNSRTVNRRQSLGLGNEKVVEVTVHPPGQPLPARSSTPGMGPTSSGNSAVHSTEIAEEVARIEQLVLAIREEYDDAHRRHSLLADNPLGTTLIQAGTRAETVEKLLTRFIGATGKNPTDRVGALTWLTENLRASNCDWDGFYGCHAFLGRPAAGRTTMVLQAAAKLQELGRKTLVLSVMPGHTGEVRRLQTAASEMGFDAAVIQDRHQLAKSEAHLARYDAVLVDLPAFGHAAMDVGAPLHTWLAGNSGFHRHLVVPLDADLDDLLDLAQLGREWHSDWIAASRCDLSRRPGKFLDLAEIFPVPFSLLGELGNQGMTLSIAASGAILDRVLGTPGLMSEGATN